MKTIRISKSRLSEDLVSNLRTKFNISNETDFAFDFTGTNESLKDLYSIIEPIQTRNPFLKQV